MVRASALIVALLPAGLHGAPVAAPHVQVELVAESRALEPGRAAWLGLRFLPERGWHVYWRNPGDSGEAPSVAWTVPPGFAVGALEWPAPERIPVGPMANYGYDGETLLPARLDVPGDVAAAAVEVRARARWLVCNEEECIPGARELALTLPVEPGTPRASDAAALFQAARARMPVPPPSDWTIGARVDDERLSIVVRGRATPLDGPVLFFPFGREVVEHAAPQAVTLTDDGFRLDVPRWRQAAGPPASVDGVLTIGDHAYALAVPVRASGAGVALEALALAFAGGLLLNLMPCVFPVLAIKAFALIGLPRADRRRARGHGLAYGAGVLASFWALAGVLLAVRAGGQPLGWGFQLQSPVVVAGLAALFFWLALGLLGLTTIGGSLMGVGNRLAAGGGLHGAFFSGVLATVVATPCSAPFMGTALGYALAQPAPVALGVFTALGAGLAFPWVLVTFVPALASRLPRPGRWMETLKELLAFPLLATVVWLTWVASLQGGPQAVAAILGMLLLLALAAWTRARWPGRWSRLAAAGALAAAIALAATIGSAPAPSAAHDGWEPYSAARLDEHRRAGRPVFVDFTAAWCVTCQVNERLVLGTAAVRAKMREAGVALVRADWTNADPEITRALQGFGRDGVPLYVLYTGNQADRPRILPQILTRDLVITELERLDERSET